MRAIKYLFLTLLSVGIIAMLALFENHSTKIFKERESIFFHLYTIKSLESSINYEVLKNSFFLYQNYDTIIDEQKKLDAQLALLKKELLQLKSQKLLQAFKEYRSLLRKKEELIEAFLRYNSALKNSSIYIPKLIKQMFDRGISDREYERLCINILTSIFLAKKSSDKVFLQNLSHWYQKLIKYRFKYKDQQHLHRILTAHVSIFLDTFPKYRQSLQELLNLPTQQKLKHLSFETHRYFQAQVDSIERLFRLLILFYIAALALIIFFIYKLDKEMQNLQKLKEELATKAISDDLTKLRNRRAYKSDVRRVKRPFFALVNIDGFKHYNDFYGTSMGDHILRQSALIIKKAVPHHYDAKIYRIGADEFGILIDEELSIEASDFAQRIIKAFEETPITFKSITLKISVSVTITRKRPLLETADIAMKHLKKERRFKYMLYKDEYGFMQEIKENIKRSKILKSAIEEGRLIPFFQPIIETKNLKIVKYEVLARVRHENGKLESIYPYLAIAKELGLYSSITRQIISQAAEAAHRYKKPISVNISMKDIENPDFLGFLGQLYKRYPEISRLLSFEILESETLKDYEAVKNFISIIHSQGGEVGIDDFGSGYSNFAHIFNLNIDFIKIDGSLIKELQHDPTAKLIVKNILTIAHQLGVKTVGEFIVNKELFDIVSELGIDYSQGFFLGEPSPVF